VSSIKRMPQAEGRILPVPRLIGVCPTIESNHGPPAVGYFLVRRPYDRREPTFFSEVSATVFSTSSVSPRAPQR
jgi:hypothetical protein